MNARPQGHKDFRAHAGRCRARRARCRACGRESPRLWRKVAVVRAAALEIARRVLNVGTGGLDTALVSLGLVLAALTMLAAASLLLLECFETYSAVFALARFVPLDAEILDGFGIVVCELVCSSLAAATLVFVMVFIASLAA